MDQLLRITLDAIGRVTSNHEYRLKALEGYRPQAESCASDCSADGRRIKQGEASVQPAGPEQTLAIKDYFERRIAFWQAQIKLGRHHKNEEYLEEAEECYCGVLSIIEGEAGGGQDDRSRPAG